MNEFRLAARRLRQRPASTFASVVTLGAAIGAAAVTWSALSAVLLNPLPVREPDRLVVVGRVATTGTFAGSLQRGVIYPYYSRVQESGVFEGVAAAWLPPMTLLTRLPDQPPERASIAFVTHTFFDLLGVAVPVGRGIAAEDDRRGAAPAAILSDRYWRGRWNASPDVIGRTLSIAETTVTIVGIAAPGFRGLNLAEAPDIYLPFHTISDIGGPFTNFLAETTHQSSPSAMVTIVARLRGDTTPALATARLAQLPPPAEPRLGEVLTASPLQHEALPLAARGGIKQFSTLLAATVALLLLTGCASVGLLLVLRTEARRAEFAMCLALGATRAQLWRGILVEGVLLAVSGAALSVPAAAWLFGLLRAFQLPGGVAVDLLGLRIDGTVLAGVAAAATLCMVAISLVASLFGWRASVSDALRSSSGSTPRLSGGTARRVLVTSQVAVALLLLTGAGLFARSLAAALALNHDIDPARLVAVPIGLGPYGYTPERATTFFDQLRERLAANRTIASVGVSVSQSSFGGGYGLPINGVARVFPSEIYFRSVDDAYFTTLRVPLVSGRTFTAADTAAAPPVGIVSASFARLLGEGGSAIGRRITMPYSQGTAPAAQVEVVGVVPDVITSVSVMEPLVLYMPIAQQYPIASREFLVRAADDANVMRVEVLATIRQLDAAVTPPSMYTMQERLGRQMSAQRFGATVLAALGVVAIFLTLLGTYVLADAMAHARRREMGIRAALGATRRQLAAIVFGETARLVGLGVAAGLVLAWGGANAMRSFLFGIGPLDPLTLGSVAVLIVLLAFAVTGRAALRAARVDLSTVLKAE